MQKEYTPQIMPPNGREIRVIEYLAGLDKRLIDGEQLLEARLKSIPNAWRDFRLARTKVEKVLDGIYDTLPEKTMVHMARLSAFGETIIRPKPAIKMLDDVLILMKDDVKYLINVAIAAECAVCLKDKREQKKCKLRGALSTVAYPAVVKNDGLCPYTHVAEQNEYGRYI